MGHLSTLNNTELVLFVLLANLNPKKYPSLSSSYKKLTFLELKEGWVGKTLVR